MGAIPYMPLYVADYLSDTAHLTHEEMGMYSRLIALYWQRGSALPADDKRLSLMLGIPYERSTDVLRTIKEFFIDQDGLLYHKRIEAELAKFRDKSEKAKAAVNSRYKDKPAEVKPTDVVQTKNGRTTDVERTYYHTDTDTEKDKEKNSIQERKPPKPDPEPAIEPEPEVSPKPPKKDASRAIAKPEPEENGLYHSIKDSFLSRNGGAFTNWPKEGQAIKGIIDKCTKRHPSDPGAMAKAMIEKFWQLKNSSDKFYSAQPFLPSVLNSSGIFDRVLEQYRDKSEQNQKASALHSLIYGGDE